LIISSKMRHRHDGGLKAVTDIDGDDGGEGAARRVLT